MWPQLLAIAALTVGQGEEPALVLRSHPQIQQAVFHPDGKRIYFVARGGVEAYDTATGKFLFHGAGGHHLVCSPDGKRIGLVSTMRGMLSISGLVVVQDADTGKEQHQLAGTSAAFSPDGRWLLSHSNYEVGRPEFPPPKVQITNLTTGKTHVAELRNDDPKENAGRFASIRPSASFRFTKDHKKLVAGARNETGQWTSREACELATGKVTEIPNDSELIHSHDLRFSADGKRFVSPFSIFDVQAGKAIAKLDSPKEQAGHGWSPALQLSPDGKVVFLRSTSPTTFPAEEENHVHIARRGHLQVYDAETGKWKHAAVEVGESFTIPLTTYKKIGNAHREAPHFAVNPQATTAIAYDARGLVTVWDLATRKLLRTMRDGGHSARPEILAFNHDGSRLASASADGEVVLWDAKSGLPLRLMDQAANLNDVQFRPKSKELVGVGFDLMYVWNFETGRLLRTFERKGNAFQIDCHPEGKIVAVADYWGDARLMDIETGKVLHELTARGRCDSLAFHPSGKTLATLAQTGAVRVWDVDSGKKLHDWFGAKSDDWQYRGQQIAFSADGAHLFVRERYNTFALVNAKTGERLNEHTLENKESRNIAHASWRPDGTRVAVAFEGSNDVEEHDLKTGKMLHSYEPHTHLRTRVQYSRDGSRLATTGYDHVIRIHAVRAASEKIP